MFRPRVIPTLLLNNEGLVKTIKFKKPTYIGDPINAVRIFNESYADELIFLDISASIENRIPSLELISELSDECFMPFSVGGGIRNINDVEKIIQAGAEKVVINSFAIENPNFINEASKLIGSQSVVASIDVKKNFFNKYQVYTYSGTKKNKFNLIEYVKMLEDQGAGEIYINSIDRDGMMNGYDIDLIKSITKILKIPVICSGGARNIDDFKNAIKIGGASAVSAGSMFVFQKKRDAVLINFPTRQQLSKLSY